MTTIAQAGNFGDLKVFRVLIGDKDVSAAVLSAHVFQEIFSPTTTAIINFRDTANLLMTLPIRAGSKVSVHIETDMNCAGDGEQSWEFVIYKIADKVASNQGLLEYGVYAADEAFLLNQTKRIHKSFPNVKTSAMAVNVVREAFDRTLVVDESDNTMHMVVPGWTPFYTMSWLLQTTTKDNAADYVFYQTADSAFAFKSFETLYSDPAEYSDITFKVRPTNLRDESGDAMFDYSTTIGVYWFDHFDGLSNLASGFYTSKTASYDFVSKKWETKTFKFGDDNAEDKKYLQVDSPYMMDTEDANISFIPKHGGMFDGQSYSDTADQWIASRKSSLMKFEQEKLIVQFPGSAGAAKWFAKSCDVDLPAQDSMSDEEFDKHRRGRYVITHMAHMINKDTYTINAELVKKRLESV
jgi:hypothetical protein